jgi:large subunit ribosomal protein L25
MTAIAATKRDAFGSKVAQRERDNGQVPTTICQGGAESQHITIGNKDAEVLVTQLAKKSVLSIDGNDQSVLLKTYDRHPVSDQLLHIDLQAITDDTMVTIEVPLDPDTLNCPGIKAGGLLEMMRRTVAVKCLAKDLPDTLRVPLDTVDVAQTVYAADVEMPEGVTLITKPRVAVLSVLLTRGMRKEQQAARDEEKVGKGK